MNQTDAPIADNLHLFLQSPIHGFGGPGHHLGQGAPEGAFEAIGQQVFRSDILTPKGLDDRTKRFNVMEDAEELAAEAWGADAAFYGTSGTTQNLQALLLTVAGPGQVVLVPGNEHRAAHSLAQTAGLAIRPYPAAIDRAHDVEHGATPDAVAAALAAHPEARAVVVVSPSFFGFTCDIAAIADLVHAHGIPLIVDGAWGGALPFCDALPPSPLALGADAMVSSIHKTMGALAQGSVVLLRGDRIGEEAFQRALECVQTTSPSVPILASLDLARRDHALRGQELWTAVLTRVDRTAAQLREVPGIGIYDLGDVPAGMVTGQDRSKLVIDVSGLGISGFAADEWLQSQRRVSVVLSDARHLVATFGVGTSDADADALVAGIADLSAAARQGDVGPATPTLGYADMQVELSAADPAQVAHGPMERLAYADAVGRIAAEIVAPTPPEVPRLAPGWVVTAETAAWLAAMEQAGAYIPDVVGARDGKVWVAR